MNYSPIILFVYNRPSHTEQTLKALSQNTLAPDSILYIFCDGPKPNSTSEQLEKIKETRKIVKSHQWCKEVNIIESKENKGLAASIIQGVTEIINKHGTAIILEDDIVTGKYFLEFMNESLSKYKDEKEIWHISGWRDPIKHTKNNSSYLYPTMDCWSWATWTDRWQYFKKDPLYYKSIFSPQMIESFNVDNTDKGMFSQIEDNITGKINTWAIFWYATIFVNNGLCLGPTKSLCKNIGFDNSGVHCGTNSAEEIIETIDNKIQVFPKKIELDKKEFSKNKKFNIKKNKEKINLTFIIKTIIPKPLKQALKHLLHK